MSMRSPFVIGWSFVFRGPSRYAKPPQKSSRNRTTRPKLNHNPSGNIDASFLPRTDEENALFIELGVEESLRAETYLAAFLACWLCKFVFPNKKIDYIRASVFKIASLMAHGEKCSLAVPVLASIYHGLKEVSTSQDLGACKALFPIHYVYGWIGAYFDTYYRVKRPQRGPQMCKVSGEKMAKHFDLSNARELFQQVSARQLHHLAMLQGRELHLTDRDEQSNSWSDFFLSLRSSFITLRHDDIHIVESYSPHRFSRQFGFCQDVPGKLIERPYDGSLKMLVQFWDSCVRLGGSSKVIVPTRPSEEGPLMTREYADWWSARRVHSSRQSAHIILKVPRKDDIPLSSKDDQRQKDTHGGSSKSKLRSKDPSPSTKLLSESTLSTGGDAHVDKGAKNVLLSSKTTTATVEVTNNPCKRKAPPTSPNKNVAKEPNVAPTNEERTQASALPNEILNVSATSSSNESDVSHDIHWNRSKKKAKDTSHSEFALGCS
ncbi:PREDICTED: uncharacterized protein LOC109215149 [Nicotiana attenuata]|uniref:uncharacterized protein LOC109215149 n=1 Tax=Nicotiana attenuata TaxID=49451 RepID=UPI0009056ECD|nr:PREDICTED: uncharacterized protein LOC109215149 [Nicotiana attenuata]